MNRKKIFVLLGLAAALGMTGCGNSGNKETEKTETAASQEEAVNEDAAEENPDEELAEEDLDEELVVEDLDEEEAAVLADEDAEDETEEALDPITPSDYLVKNVSDYVTLGSLEGLSATQYIYEVTDELVEETIQSDLEMYADEVEVDRASAEGDVVYVELTSTVDGEDPASESTYFTLGYEEYGADFDEELTGVVAGETKKFSITFDEDIWVEEWMNQTVDFKAQITSVCELSAPEYNEDFITEYTEFTSMEEYEEYIRDYLSADYEDLSYSDVIDSLFSSASAQSVFGGYPQELYDASKEELLSFYFAFTGSTDEEEVFELFGITEEDLDAEILNTVDRRLLVNAICEANDLEVTEEEYISFVEDYAEYYGYESAAQFEEDNTRTALVWSLYESKAAEYLYEIADITEETYTEEDEEEDFELIEDDTDILGEDGEVLEGDELLSEDGEVLEDVIEETETGEVIDAGEIIEEDTEEA